jgi:hypothetical protein
MGSWAQELRLSAVMAETLSLYELAEILRCLPRLRKLSIAGFYLLPSCEMLPSFPEVRCLEICCSCSTHTILTLLLWLPDLKTMLYDVQLVFLNSNQGSEHLVENVTERISTLKLKHICLTSSLGLPTVEGLLLSYLEQIKHQRNLKNPSSVSSWTSKDAYQKTL